MSELLYSLRKLSQTDPIFAPGDRAALIAAIGTIRQDLATLHERYCRKVMPDGAEHIAEMMLEALELYDFALQTALRYVAGDRRTLIEEGLPGAERGHDLMLTLQSEVSLCSSELRLVA